MTMMNDDESFIREVNEELRSEQMRSAWKRFGPFVIGLAVLIVVGVAGGSFWQWWKSTQASSSGDRYLTALRDADGKKTKEAEAELQALIKDGYGAYPVLARMRLATLKAENGDKAAAVADFSAIGEDSTVPSAIRNAARIRSAWLLVDVGTYEQVSKQVEELAVPSSSMRHAARETLGLAAYKAGDLAKARDWFKLIVDDAEAPASVATRARKMLALITASGKLA